MLLDLIRNSIEVMEGCNLRQLTISTRIVSDEEVDWPVADTAPGRIAEVAEHLFEPFRQHHGVWPWPVDLKDLRRDACWSSLDRDQSRWRDRPPFHDHAA
jgi:hypothetical protein